jgi:hypothetical protein
MRGAIADQEFRQRLRNHSQRTLTQNRGMVVEGESEADAAFYYDYSRILQALGLSSTQDVSVEQVVKIASFKDQKKNELKRHLKELTTNINSEALVQVEVSKIEHISEKLKDLQDTMADLFAREKELKARLDDISNRRTNILLSFLTPLSFIIPNFYKLHAPYEEVLNRHRGIIDWRVFAGKPRIILGTQRGQGIENHYVR